MEKWMTEVRTGTEVVEAEAEAEAVASKTMKSLTRETKGTGVA